MVNQDLMGSLDGMGGSRDKWTRAVFKDERDLDEASENVQKSLISSRGTDKLAAPPVIEIVRKVVKYTIAYEE